MANTFSIQVKGLDELIKNANNVSKNAGAELKGLMVKNTTYIQNEAKRVSPERFKNQTGNLRRSINRRVFSGLKGIVSTDEKYGEYVEFGTRPHTIYPKNKKMLAFKVGGKMVFARKVNHKGSRPYPFMQPAFESGKKYVQDTYEIYISDIVKRLAK